MKPFMGTFVFMKIVFLVSFVFFLALGFVPSALGFVASAGDNSNGKAPKKVIGPGNFQGRNGSLGRAPPPHQTPPPSPSPSPPPTTPPPPSPSPPPTTHPSPPPSPSLPPPAPPPPPPNSSPLLKSKKFGGKQLVYGVIIISVGLFVIGVVFIFLFWHKRSRAVEPLEESSNRPLQTSLTSGLLLFKRSELESACESFSNIVGSVSDGSLYKGRLSSGTEIAVSSIKMDETMGGLSEAQYRKKIATLSKVKYRNFVNLLGYCEAEPLTRMLVFEYVPNGALSEHLHATETVALSWASRMRIAMGVAYCLDYMHQLDPPIILKNLDTNLIYLTDDYAAKIADFELWSGTAEGRTVVGSSEFLLQEVPDKGSIVQKFGIVLLELLSGRDPYFEQSGPVEMWAREFLKAEAPLGEKMDPQMSSFPEDRAAAIFELIKQCLDPKPEEALSMKEVTARLKEITGVSQENAAPFGYDLDIVSEGPPSYQ